MSNQPSLFIDLEDRAVDGLLALMLAYRADTRENKLDLGIGVYRDDSGATPVMQAMKAAERRLAETQETKTYLGGDGDTGFIARLAPIVFGEDRVPDPRLVGMQTPGGTGALRLAGELVARHTARGRIWVGSPTWANHHPILAAAGCDIVDHPFYDRSAMGIDFAGMMEALEAADTGDALLLHGCSHNPTGADFTEAQWEAIGALVARRRLVPVVDLAYQGLGRGLDADAFGARLLFDRAEVLVVAYSCDKNFGLYRERTGALWARAAEPASAPRLHVAMREPARASWSMPPDHGAAAVRTILEDEELTRIWREELDTMRSRIVALRNGLAAAHPGLAAIAAQTGIFSMLPIDREAVMALRRDEAIYIADDGRMNVAGLKPDDIARLATALAPHLRR